MTEGRRRTVDDPVGCRLRTSTIWSSVLLGCSTAVLLSGVVILSAARAEATPTEWHHVTSPDSRGNPNNRFNAVSCVSPTDCVAVGVYTKRQVGQNTLTELWDGRRWSITKSSNPGIGNYLAAVSCTSATECTAVGDDTDESGAQHTLIESFDGTQWSVTPDPQPGDRRQLPHRGVLHRCDDLCGRRPVPRSRGRRRPSSSL